MRLGHSASCEDCGAVGSVTTRASSTAAEARGCVVRPEGFRRERTLLETGGPPNSELTPVQPVP
jgi:hypothetical protein